MSLKAEKKALRHLLKLVEESRPQMLATLQKLVEMESPSSNKGAVDLLGAELAREFKALGGRVTVHPQKKFGNHLQVDFPGAADEKPVMLLGHFDTVWDIGTLAQMPYKVEKGRIFGPGVYDMKVGIVMMMHAIAAAREANGGTLPRPVKVWLVTDEEVGSESSRATTEELARSAAAVFVIEPSQGPDGALKTSRKGVGSYTVKVIGKASHSGVDFEEGQSAIVELAQQISRITTFTDLKKGTTVNPGIIQGGTRVNVIAAEASTDVDVRVTRIKDAAVLEKKFRGLKPVNRKCKLEVEGGVNRPPMERTEKVVRLFRLAEQLSKGLGFKVKELATGGGSDGNFTAALGIPTLDGLGGVGEGAHALHESIVMSEIPLRTALLAALITHAERG
ncbi:MAG TPA: M20 family metallopeptidase [Terriglobales bacterium]|nr:M20 family metallopeptidase [Terriglobales bacterium]